MTRMGRPSVRSSVWAVALVLVLFWLAAIGAAGRVLQQQDAPGLACNATSYQAFDLQADPGTNMTTPRDFTTPFASDPVLGCVAVPFNLTVSDGFLSVVDTAPPMPPGTASYTGVYVINISSACTQPLDGLSIRRLLSQLLPDGLATIRSKPWAFIGSQPAPDFTRDQLCADSEPQCPIQFPQLTNPNCSADNSTACTRSCQQCRAFGYKWQLSSTQIASLQVGNVTCCTRGNCTQLQDLFASAIQPVYPNGTIGPPITAAPVISSPAPSNASSPATSNASSPATSNASSPASSPAVPTGSLPPPPAATADSPAPSPAPTPTDTGAGQGASIPPSPTDSSSSSSSSSPIGAIVGAVVGGVVFAAAVLAGVVWCYLRKQRASGEAVKASPATTQSSRKEQPTGCSYYVNMNTGSTLKTEDYPYVEVDVKMPPAAADDTKTVTSSAGPSAPSAHGRTQGMAAVELPVPPARQASSKLLTPAGSGAIDTMSMSSTLMAASVTGASSAAVTPAAAAAAGSRTWAAPSRASSLPLPSTAQGGSGSPTQAGNAGPQSDDAAADMAAIKEEGSTAAHSAPANDSTRASRGSDSGCASSSQQDSMRRTGSVQRAISMRRMNSGASGSHTGGSVAASVASSIARQQALVTMRINWSDLTIGGILGEGGFGKVYKGSWQGNRVAIKVLSAERADPTFLASLYQEALIMAELRHPCIARVYGVVDQEPHHALVMQYYRRGPLSKYMTTPAFYHMDLPKRLRLALQVASGMQFMHSLGVLHQDLKSGNLLLEDDGLKVVIADFGLASAKQTSASLAGALTISISPPEVLQDPLAPRTAASDTYAFAIVLLELMTGKPSYRGLKPADIKQLVLAGRRPAIPPQVPDSVAALVHACWAHDPAARPQFTEIVQQLNTALVAVEGELCTDTTIDGTSTKW